MGKVKKFTSFAARAITGGKDPQKLVEEFIIKLGFDPDKVVQEKAADSVRWMISLDAERELEIQVDGLRKPSETVIYLGINVVVVPLKGAQEVLVSALEIADGLVGAKISLVGHFLVLSATLGAAGISLDDLDYSLRLILSQHSWFKEALQRALEGE